ncbi:MAG: DUF1328 domain-containing protein [Bdellovibrionota bacterium]
MVRAAIGFFVLALVAYLLGAGGIAGMSVEIGRILLGVFLVLAVISFIASLIGGRRASLALAGLLFLPALSQVAIAEETAVEKVETGANHTVDKVKETGRTVDEKICETVNGKVKCVAKKVKNAVKNTGDKAGTKVEELKKKAD